MKEQIDIWLVGNTGLRNPNRIQDGFKVFAGSPFVGNLHGKDNEIGFMNLLNEKGIIQNEEGKDESGSKKMEIDVCQKRIYLSTDKEERWNARGSWPGG